MGGPTSLFLGVPFLALKHPRKQEAHPKFCPACWGVLIAPHCAECSGQAHKSDVLSSQKGLGLPGHTAGPHCSSLGVVLSMAQPTCNSRVSGLAVNTSTVRAPEVRRVWFVTITVLTLMLVTWHCVPQTGGGHLSRTQSSDSVICSCWSRDRCHLLK